MSWVIGPARQSDHSSILEVVRAAFTEHGGDARQELEVVERTWEYSESQDVIELVAARRDDLVGHVLAAPGKLGDGGGALGVAPLSVRPPDQNCGVGSALMRELVEVARGRGWPLILLLGDPAFYGRFGFAPAGDQGIWYAPAGPDNPHFMALRLGESPSAPGTAGGQFTYCWE